MITVHRAIRPAERAQTFQARHAAYCLPAGGKVPLMTCRAQAPWKPHDEFDESPQTLLYYVRDGATVVGSSRLLGYHPRLGLQEQRLFIEREPGLNLSETMEPSRLSLIPAYRDKGKRRQALLALFSAMVGDSLDHRCTLLVATLRGDVVMLLTMMKTAVTLLGDQPVGSDPGIEADYHLSGEPIFPVTIDLLESATWMFTDAPAAYRIIYQTDQPPARHTQAQPHELRARAHTNLITVARHMHEWRTRQAREPLFRPRGRPIPVQIGGGAGGGRVVAGQPVQHTELVEHPDLPVTGTQVAAQRLGLIDGTGSGPIGAG
jgi:hypothetical protein